MKKVLFLIYQLVGGGAEKVMVDIVNHMDKTQYDITVMTVIDCTKDKHLLHDEIKYRYIFKDFLKCDRLFFKLMKSATPQFLHSLFIKEKYDIEISALEGIPSKIISGNNSMETKKISIIHADSENIAWPSGRYKNFKQEEDSYNSFDKLIFVSKNTKKNFVNKFNIDENKTVVIHNPFDINHIIKKSQEEVTDYKQEEGFLFISVGRLEKVKGFNRLIEAFNEVYKTYPKIKLLIIGEGSEKDNLSKQIREFKLENNIELLGYRENPYKYINLCDSYICSSLSEGLSSSVIEAMIINKPIVTTDCGGMDEILLDNKCGLIASNNINGIIYGMKEILKNDNSLLMKMKIEQKRRIKEFSFEKYFSELEKYI
ncbi:glycosyltransferase [Bacillus sp. FJAT-53711]|uniref:Glycosyltransferase n=1 Tax=Bacillus yunxiaonensis TaxID=3127665 RepID=A0ABU8FV44_9BACI